MPLLSNREACNVTDAFLITLYGSATFRRWKNMKHRMQFDVESDYVNWLLDVADHYDKESGTGVETTQQCLEQHKYLVTDTHLTQQTGVKRERDSADTVVKKVKYEEPQNVDYEAYEAEAETVSHGVIGGDAAYRHTSNVVETRNDYEEVTLSDDDENNTNYDRLPPSVVDGSSIGNISGSGGGETSTLEPDGSSKSLRHSHRNTTATITNSVTATHDETGRKSYRCPHCAFKSKYKASMNRHILAIHQQLKVYDCAHCTYSSAYANDVRRHMKRAHKEGEPLVV